MSGSLEPDPKYFPPPRTADEYGLVAVDPRLDVDRMLDAYRHGIFPWPAQEHDRISRRAKEWFVGWYSPDPRAILPLDGLHVPRRLARKLRQGQFRFRWNANFRLVLEKCATLRDRKNDRWLSPDLLSALAALHAAGYTHSVEVFHAQDDFKNICGGIYGVSVGAAFAAESMFFVRSDASKAAVVALVEILRSCEFQVLDIQQASKHMRSMGAVEIARDEFLKRVSRAQKSSPSWPSTLAEPVTLQELAALGRRTFPQQ